MGTELANTVQKSYSRCIASGKLFDRFYDIFLATDPDIKERFANTDFDKQKKLLRHGINLMIMFSEDNLIGKSGIERIRFTHSKHKLNIPSPYYALWKSSLIKAISEVDNQFNAEIEHAWSKTLDVGIEHIKLGYDSAH